MKFPRNSKILRRPFDFAPFAAVFFLLVIFMAVGMLITTTPGVPLQIPVADDLPGTTRPTVDVAVDATDRLYLDNQLVNERQLKTSLHNTVHSSTEKLTLVIHADKSVTYEQLLHLTQRRHELSANVNLNVSETETEAERGALVI